ncbi:leukocyte cell-derived chemotaxin 1 isoform X1 [Triplophysa rosa]|uniref:leukocyte cell-derived chemotaxin 1 isoform X1 n=1 Tax=Triplophysa rosa TaxID=992332 RepID=UPI002545C8D9|nr:leukocyte cell-derived chemotaxin 1 isoform X1 [Triplophysa rosa]
MEATSEKLPLEAYDGVIMKPSGSSRLRRTLIAAFIAGALVLLVGGIGGFYLWQDTDKEAIAADYSRNINIKMIDDSFELNSESNPEGFTTAAGDGNILEAHDFKAGITAMRFPAGEKCYIRSQSRSKPSEEKLFTFGVKETEIMTVKSDVDSVVWIVSEEPLKDSRFLSPEILRFCGNLPVYWQRPAMPRALRKRRSVRRQRRQNDGRLNQRQSRGRNTTSAENHQRGSEFNSENPYHRNQEAEETMTFDSMLDHRGICCAECRRSYTHCERVCEPLGGYEPWPYNYHGCRPVCRVIMPCRWWVARIMGLV